MASQTILQKSKFDFNPVIDNVNSAKRQFLTISRKVIENQGKNSKQRLKAYAILQRNQRQKELHENTSEDPQSVIHFAKLKRQLLKQEEK